MNNTSECPLIGAAVAPSIGVRGTGAHALTVRRSKRPLPRVLFVDDEPSVLEGLQIALRRVPFVIRTTTVPEVALTMFREEPFDVIVADERMPGMCGSELLSNIACEFPAAARILLTGYATVETAVRAVNHAGIVRLLLKPCSSEELREAIELALRAKPPESVGRAPSGRRAFLVSHRDRTKREFLARDVSELVLRAQKVVALTEPSASRAFEISTRIRTQTGDVHTVGNFVESTRHRVPLLGVDRWIVRHVLEVVRDHGSALARRKIGISFNVAARSLADGGFVQFLSRELSRSVVASRVLIEIKMPVLLKSLQTDGQRLRRFFDSDCFEGGCRLCIDGVGEDFKGLAALKDLPIAAVKIDSRYVRDILTNRQSEYAVHSIIEWARQGRIDVAADGIETTAIAERLRTLGVQYGQGSAFGMPEPIHLVLASLYR